MGKANFVSVKVFQRRLACGISIQGGKALPIETAAGWDTVTDRVGHSLSSSGIQSQPGWDTVMAQVGYSHRLSGIQSQLRCDTVTARWDTVTARMEWRQRTGKLTQTWVCIELGCRICQWMSHCSFLDTWTYICIYPSIGHIQALSLRLLLNHWSSVLRLLGSWSEQLLMSWRFTLQMATRTLSRF